MLRDDHDAHIGGDVIQLMAYVEALQGIDVDAVAATLSSASGDFDVINLYNLTRSKSMFEDLRRSRRRWPAAKIAIFPVYWPTPIVPMLRARAAAVASRAAKSAMKDSLWWRSLRKLLREADYVFPNSPSEVRRLSRHFAIRPGRHWTIVPNGVWLRDWRWERKVADRARLLRELDLDPHSRTVVICVGRVEPRKNQMALIDAVDRLHGIALLLVGPAGEIAYADGVRRKAMARPGRVAMIGPRPARAIRDMLAIADIHVLPSFSETPGLVSLEAAAVGCEVVVTRTGSAYDYFGDDAHYADPWSRTSIAAAIERARDRPLQPASRQRAARFDWSNAAAALAAAYRATER